MTTAKLKYTAAMVGSLIIGGLSTAAISHFMAPAAQAESSPAERKVLYWYDPMKPDVRFEKPGKSPFMDMDLVAKYADEGGDTQSSGVRIDPTQVHNLGLRTAKVSKGRLDYTQILPANVSYNEYQFVIVQARAEGFIEKVYPLTVGDKVRKGTPLVAVTIPSWVEAQSEYLLLANSGGTATQLEGVLERLRLAGMPEADIQRMRTTRRVQTQFTLTAPIDGVLTAFSLKSGMNIAKDNVVAQIQGMDPVWISAAVPESIAYLLNDSTRFTVSIPAYPGKNFTIQKTAILPSVDPATRTLQVRLQVNNPDELLKPGMNAYLKLNAQSDEMLLIPSQAVIDTGDEQRVIAVDSNGEFVPKKIQVLHESRDKTGIAGGLSAGESIVVNGLFLIDSEANISGALDRMRHSADAHTGH
ncbi:TPA: efflux RND transporter periplasmic adaptor subunit [Kluyvera cryocrescens]|uniref:Efflux RND transporter periplasmic adaptor subunit n=1 Tax=Kluyvera cryocrescens TaxID=580 RepID=A0AAW9C2T3_KLUCR|nr:efflux RND transporter periplasmic adaptor subunit [Kluyvera cryocrescens]MCX2866785.1 efflux RND transporter periplasmic adaptor subunit [Kluyvera cryocrescens]MDW3776198.1 efflux RND transporter periplasmic adaptor subunit [Kluyvera cryocrescens]MEB7714094.1 efflux RND transporter periplasmic adaptor subunit [Kluyvera cryocrescens]WNN72332.1 efflux RND transporter periplasmic adaptor subunit [Kluyvera cryocrescens]SQC32895.1 Cation efflux system protein CusB precursor [Kluyvera cryocresce